MPPCSWVPGVVGAEDVSLANGTSGTFAQPGVGTGISVTTEMALSGADKDAYILEQPSSLMADITPMPVTVTARSASTV